jgi:hypothetical protein
VFTALTDQPNVRYTVQLGPTVRTWVDLGWCSRSIGGTGASWLGPKPAWIGYQRNNTAWIYRLSGHFVMSTPYTGPGSNQGRPYGTAFHAGQNITGPKYHKLDS